MSLSDALLQACTLTTYEGAERTCRWCGGPLSGRQQRWCGQPCVDAYLENHDWNTASKAAKRRDGVCTACGETGDTTDLRAWGAFLRWAYAVQGRHMSPLTEPGRTIRRLFEHEALQRRLETDHIEPILGRHGQGGCHHHLDGLRTLCHRCHLAATAEQFGRTRADQPTLFGAAS